MKEINTSDLNGEERFEAEAAHGKNADLVELEPEDLAEPTETVFLMARQLEVGDHVEIGNKRHDQINASGEIVEMNEYSMTLDTDEPSMSSYHGFDSFGGDRGMMATIESVNGDEDVDIDYGEVEV